MNNDFWFASSLLLGIILAIITSILANIIQPRLERRKGLLVSLFVGMLTVWILLSTLVNRSANAVPILPVSVVNGEILYYENKEWVLKKLADGSKRIVPFLGTNICYVSCSPDGKSILYSYREEGKKYAELYSLDVQSNTNTPFLSLPDLDLVEPAWSPDGSLVAFVVSPDCCASNLQTGLYTFSPKTGQVRRLSTWDERVRFPTWSPDSSQIAFEALPTKGTTSTRIMVVDRNGNNRTQISPSTDSSRSHS